MPLSNEWGGAAPLSPGGALAIWGSPTGLGPAFHYLLYARVAPQTFARGLGAGSVGAKGGLRAGLGGAIGEN